MLRQIIWVFLVNHVDKTQIRQFQQYIFRIQRSYMIVVYLHDLNVAEGTKLQEFGLHNVSPSPQKHVSVQYLDMNNRKNCTKLTPFPAYNKIIYNVDRLTIHWFIVLLTF